MPTDYRTVRLMKNRLYPTYQLHAVMAARKTTPENGLKIGALTILDWVRHRLGTGVPEELNAICHRHCVPPGAGRLDDADRRAGPRF